MMMSDDDDVEPQLNVLKDYYLLDAADQPICFSVLPFQFKDTDEVPECKKSVFLWGTADPGIKVYKKVVAWKLGLEGKQPEIAVLSAEGSWICLVKPKNSYEETIRTILITVQMLHFLRRKPEESEKNLRIHLHKVFDKFDVRPSEDDIRNHRSLVKQFAEKDSTLAKSEILRAFIEERSRKKNSEVGSDNVGIKESFIADDGDIEEMVESDEEEEEDLFDSICAICDNGGDLLCCDGPCMRSFHAKVGTGEDSYCDTLGYTEAEVEAMKNFLCKNCEYKKHQCFICGVLEPSDGPTAKVFLCNNATCGHFYHPKCVAQQLHPHNRNEALELEKKITDGFSFTCPIHWCFRCKSLEDRTQEHLQFAVCRRCPKSYHRKCLPREISFKDIEEEDIVTRAWKLAKRILIYCLDHEIDSDIDTPVRNHIKFPRIPSIEKPTKFVKKSTKVLFKNKKRTFTGSIPDQPSKKPAKSPYKVRVQEGHARKFAAKSLSEQLVDKPDKKKVMSLEERTQPVPNMVKDASISSPIPANEQERLLPSSTTRKIPQSSFPIVDNETEKRVRDLVEKEVSSLTLKDVSRKCLMPSTHAYSGRQIDRIIATGKLERSVQAVGAALKMLENGGNVNDAKAVCEPEVLRQLAKWHSKLRVYISPFIYGTRYSSFGRHFTKVEKLAEIVDKLHWYVEPGDMIVDFCCGANDFSRLMKEKLDQVQKKCHFKNYDLIQPQNCFCFERRDWMTVQPKELPRGSQLIMGLNPPFGVRAALANKFIDKAMTFKPKLIILIVPEETKRLDQKKTPYDLVWEDSECLAGKAFYLPGSVDVNDKIVEGWNASTPPLYLWSHPDWTKKHRKVAEEHNHTSIGKIASHVEEGNLLDDPCPPVKKEAEPSGISNSRSGKEIENTGKTSCHLNEANLSDDLTVRKQAEATNKQNTRSGKQKETIENTACNVREASLLDGRPVKKQARSEEEKSKEANLSDNLPVKNQAEAAFQQISQSGKEKEKGRDEGKRSHDRSRKRTPDQVDSLPPEKQVEVAYEERRVIPRKRSINQEEKRDACGGDGINARREESKRGYSDMSISFPDTSNARNRFPFVPSEHSDRTVHPDGYTSYLAKEPHISTFRNATYQGSYLASSNGYNVTLEGKNDPPFYTNANDSSRKHSSSIEELTKQYAAAPTGDVYGLQSLGDDGSFCRRQSSEEWKTNYAERNAVADVPCSRYSGQICDGYLQTGIPPTTDAQAHIRIHGRPSADDYPQINRYSLGSSGARYGQPALTSPSYGFSGTTAPRSSVLDKYAPGFLGPTGLRSSVMDKYAPGILGQSAPGGLVMDKYAPSLKEANYTTRGVHDVPRHGRDMPADSMSLVPPQYPYQRPGSSGRGPPHN